MLETEANIRARSEVYRSSERARFIPQNLATLVRLAP